jgi:hypothetical protein
MRKIEKNAKSRELKKSPGSWIRGFQLDRNYYRF